jgi:hypothetical protein
MDIFVVNYQLFQVRKILYCDLTAKFNLIFFSNFQRSKNEGKLFTNLFFKNLTRNQSLRTV